MDTASISGIPYRPRLIDEALVRALRTSGAVLVEGARATGKTMSALNAAQSYALLDDLETQRAVEIAPRAVLEGESPRLLDEWQNAPQLWNLVRRAVDAASEPGRFILTGSAVPADDLTRHTGAGRFLRLRQRTMSWHEKRPQNAPTVSIRALFNGDRPQADLRARIELDQIIDHVLRPGFPAMTERDPIDSAAWLRSYIDDVARTDVRRLADIRHEPTVITQLFAALARSVATEVTYATLAADIRAVAPAITAQTVSGYAALLERLFIVEPQRPWTPKLRSRARVRQLPKRHLVDAALAAAALGAGAPALRRDLALLGSLFESAVVHDLTVFVSALGGEVRHYRDSNNNEIDAVLTLPDGRWAAVEIKLGGTAAPAALENLRRIVGQIDTESVGEPEFLLAVTGTGPILTTDDGAITAPLSALAP